MLVDTKRLIRTSGPSSIAVIYGYLDPDRVLLQGLRVVRLGLDGKQVDPAIGHVDPALALDLAVHGIGHVPELVAIPDPRVVEDVGLVVAGAADVSGVQLDRVGQELLDVAALPELVPLWVGRRTNSS